LTFRPLIGVTTSEMRAAQRVEQTPEGEPPRRELALGLAYMRALEAAGGIPLVIPPMQSGAIGPLMSQLHGICLSGGPDLDPSTYDARPHRRLGPIEPELDRFELKVARQALDLGLPVLAICRGLQLLNVAAGGTLIQHLPDRRGSDIEHRQAEPSEQATHRVELLAGSRVAAVLGLERLKVNSFHHQAVRRLGAGLEAVGWAPDGVVEAVEHPGRDFVLGVQWHAECLVDRPEQAALFSELVEASSQQARAPNTVAA